MKRRKTELNIAHDEEDERDNPDQEPIDINRALGDLMENINNNAQQASSIEPFVDLNRTLGDIAKFFASRGLTIPENEVVLILQTVSNLINTQMEVERKDRLFKKIQNSRDVFYGELKMLI